MTASLERLGSTPATDQDGHIHTVDISRNIVTVRSDGHVVTLPGTLVLTMKGHTVCVIDRAHVEVPDLRLKLTLARWLPEDFQA